MAFTDVRGGVDASNGVTGAGLCCSVTMAGFGVGTPVGNNTGLSKPEWRVSEKTLLQNKVKKQDIIIHYSLSDFEKITKKPKVKVERARERGRGERGRVEEMWKVREMGKGREMERRGRAREMGREGVQERGIGRVEGRVRKMEGEIEAGGEIGRCGEGGGER